MPKIPDLSKLAEKLGVEDIVSSVKSIMEPGSAIPDVAPGDAFGMKIVQLKQLIDELTTEHASHEKKLAQVQHLLTEVFKDAEAIRHLAEVAPQAAAPKPEAAAPTSAPAESEPAAPEAQGSSEPSAAPQAPSQGADEQEAPAQPSSTNHEKE